MMKWVMTVILLILITEYTPYGGLITHLTFRRCSGPTAVALRSWYTIASCLSGPSLDFMEIPALVESVNALPGLSTVLDHIPVSVPIRLWISCEADRFRLWDVLDAVHSSGFLPFCV